MFVYEFEDKTLRYREYTSINKCKYYDNTTLALEINRLHAGWASNKAKKWKN